MSWIVLCVSDDVACLLLYRSILELDGHNVLVAADTEDALDRLRCRRDPEFPIAAAIHNFPASVPDRKPDG
jgi:CheY-like chemotaxis protein